MLTAFDVAVGVLVLISAILATARGLTREVLSLATWAGSAAIAVYMLVDHSDIAQRYIADETVAKIATVIVTFIVALIILHLLTMRIADFVVDSRIGPLDRTLGFVFGVLRGLLIAIVVVIFGNWLLAGKMPPGIEGSQTLPHLTAMGDTLRGMLPTQLQAQLDTMLKGGLGRTDDTVSPSDTTTTTPVDPSAVDASPDDSTDEVEDATPPATAAPAASAVVPAR